MRKVLYLRKGRALDEEWSSRGREREKGQMNKNDSNSVRDRQQEEGGWQGDREVDVSGHFLWW